MYFAVKITITKSKHTNVPRDKPYILGLRLIAFILGFSLAGIVLLGTSDLGLALLTKNSHSFLHNVDQIIV